MNYFFLAVVFFLATGLFLAVVFLAPVFLAVVFLAVLFFAVGLFAVVFFAAGLLTTFLAVDLAGDAFFVVFLAVAFLTVTFLITGLLVAALLGVDVAIIIALVILLLSDCKHRSLIATRSSSPMLTCFCVENLTRLSLRSFGSLMEICLWEEG